MAKKSEIEFWRKLDEAEARKEALLNQTALWEREKDEACRIRNEANVKAERLAAQINAVIHPEMGELTTAIRLYRSALNGKERPSQEEMDGSL